MSKDAPSAGPHHHYQRIAFISTGRADAAIYEPILRRLSTEDRRKTDSLFFLAGGTHLSPRFGRTIDALPGIEGVTIVPVDHFIEGDAPHDVATTAGRAIEAFSRAFTACRPDLVFVLGDRTEMAAAALAATIHRLPIAHLHGGESTIGAYDDACRHAITKFSHIHFAAAEPYAKRIRSMNEQVWRIHTVGAPALDQLANFAPLPFDDIHRATGIDFRQPTLVIAFHPETLADLPASRQIEILLEALESRSENLLLIGANADVEHEDVGRAMKQLVEARGPSTRLIPSLPAPIYWSCLARSRALIGNSSSGIIEAHSLAAPVVNIGDRQSGRLRSPNVIDAPHSVSAIRSAIDQAVSASFREAFIHTASPFGDGKASARIAEILDQLPDPRTLLRKADAT